MMETALLLWAGWLLPVGLAMGLRGSRNRGDFWVTLSAVIAFQALFAAFFHERIPFGWMKFLLVVALSFFPALVFISGKRRSRLPGRLWKWGALGFGLFLLVENFAILGSQGWEPLLRAETYFRPPFANDGERHVILVESLLRGNAAPFIPGTTLTYQLLWHHLVAVVAGLFQGPTHYPVVQGALLATLLVGSLVFLWSLTEIFPRAFLRPWAWFVALLAYLHTDLFHIARSLIQDGRWAFEADWSASDNFYRYFSLNLVSLTAPQHQLFFLWLCVFLALVRREKNSLYWSPKTLFFFMLCWISSSLLAVFFFPFYFVGCWKNYWKRPTQLGSIGFGIGLAVLVHAVALGFSPIRLFLREGNGSPGLFWVTPGAWYSMPIIWIASSGVIGLAAMILICWEVRKGKKARFFGWEWMILGVGLLIFNYVVTMPEFRRHFSMLATFAAGFWVVGLLPELYRSFPRRVWGAVGGSLLGLGGCLHGYFIYAYVGKPSYVDPKLPWKDYLAVNEIVRTKFRGLPTLGAADKDRGLDYPPVMEATTSYSAPYHAAVHVQLTPFQLDLAGRMFVTKEFISYGSQLGYQAFVWGPFEELVWGERVKQRYVDEKALLARSGSVSLYRIEDSWRNEIQQAKQGGGAPLLALARKLGKAGWLGEAMDVYQAVLGKNAQQKEVWLELARLVDGLQQWNWKFEILQMAIGANPQFPEAYFEMGILLRGLNNPRGSVHAFRQAIAQNPKFSAAYRELSSTLAYYQSFDEARRVLDRAWRAGNRSPDIEELRTKVQSMGKGTGGG